MADNRTLDSLAWGLFIILIGIGWYIGAVYEIETGAYIALGVGLILLGLNLARSQMGIKVSKFSLFVGLVALALGVAGVLGYTLDLFLTVIILIGLFIIGEALGKLLKK
ncbi:MAG: hypothetical protein NWF10_03635 [Candidatus Bathyarchaeota archaeon]|jgi:hypothetical protein|nr:hypothetical protein [Candidatus Bathyarchaeota archaeon]